MNHDEPTNPGEDGDDISLSRRNPSRDSPSDPTPAGPEGVSSNESLGPESGTPLSALIGLPGKRAPVHDPLLGKELGGVRLTRVIAEGGMGRVYEGVQAKPSRTVAVKVMRPGFCSRAMVRRFEHEAEILARLRHPGVAQIFSAGMHIVEAVPVPYFVMEFIPNAWSITRYAHAMQLSTRKRLELFQLVCEAVAHGHQKGVIHRDLKPGNILIDSSNGQPKVIDFGVAKATDSDVTLTTMQTDIGQILGTLPYMAPEQIEGDPYEIDIRCDVYALGVVLYELLTGEMPYEVRNKPVHEVARIVREREPVIISSRDRALRGDITVIAHKCLEKNRSRRYSSASDLAGDVARYLAGEAINAHKPGLVSEVIRYGQKHRAALTVTGSAIAALAIAAIAIAIFWFKAKHAQHQAEAAQAVLAEMQERLRDEETRLSELARHASYATTVRQLDSLIKTRRNRDANTLLDNVTAAYKGRTLPIELACCRASCDTSLLTLADCGTAVSAVTFSADRSRLATSSVDGHVRIWDVSDGTNALTITGKHPGILALTFDASGSHLIAGFSDGTVRVWNMEDGTVAKTVTVSSSPVTAVAFAAERTTIAVGSPEGSVALHRLADGKQTSLFNGLGSKVTAIVFSADGATVAAGTQDGAAQAWATDTATRLMATNPQGSAVTALAISRQGDQLAIASSGKATVAYGLPAGQQILRLDGAGAVAKTVAFNSDGSLLVTSDGSVARLWNASSGRYLGVLEGHFDEIEVTNLETQGTKLATGARDGTVKLWYAARHISEFYNNPRNLMSVIRTHDRVVEAVAFSPDGTRIATGSLDCTVRMWDAATCLPLGTDRRHEGTVFAVAFSPDGELIATGGNDKTVRLWEALSGKALGVLHHASSVNALAFSADGSQLATGSDDTATLWDIPSRQPIGELKGHKGPVFAVAFSPKGSQLVTGAGDGSARIWETKSREMRVELKGHSASVRAVAFNSDGTKVATASLDSTGRVWDSTSGTCLAILAGHTRGVRTIGFSPDNTRLFSASDDKTVRIWDGFSFDQLLVLEGHTKAIRAAAMSPDGTRVATASVDWTMRLWGVSEAEIYANRLEAASIEQKLSNRVAFWLSKGQDTAEQALRDPTALTATERRVARNMVLNQLQAQKDAFPANP